MTDSINPDSNQPRSSAKAAQNAEILLQQASHALETTEHANSEVQSFALPEIKPPMNPGNADSLDVGLDLHFTFGNAWLSPEEISQLDGGSVIPLHSDARDPVQIYVDGKLIGYGELQVLNERFCVRVIELIGENSVGTPDHEIKNESTEPSNE